jgi:dolichyl-phosphooligosaccharide-protein glycotransferase
MYLLKEIIMSSQDQPVSSFKHKIKSSWPYTLAVAIISFVALWIRILPANNIFLSNGFVKFVTNDAWYHMRTLHVLVNNYPKEMFFDPMTDYPIGNPIHFGPLYDHMMAITSLILGFGHPSYQLVDYVGAYCPAVLGALTVIPVYYIGKYIGGHKTGIIAAILIAFAPGQFLSRSMIGFTDHHVAESLFSTLFMMFFMLALITANKKKLRLEDIFNKKINVLKEPLFYSVIAGVMYSAYQLVWPGAPLFAFIVIVYAVVQYTVNNLTKKSSDYLGIVGITTFLVSAVLILPFVHPEMGFATLYYSWFHVAVSLGAVIGFTVLTYVEKMFLKKKLNSYYYPLAIVGMAVLGLLALSILVPSLYSLVISAPSMIFVIPTGGMATVQEASSIFYDRQTGGQSLDNVYAYFTPTGFYASLLGMLILAGNMFRKPKSEELLLLVWSVLIFIAIYAQNRFAYYYALNYALLTAYIGGLLLEKVKWNELDEKFKANVKSPADIQGFLKYIKIEQLVAVLAIIVIFVYPVVAAAMPYTHGSDDPDGYWLEGCLWLRSNTPDPGMDFNAIYEAPKSGETFKYPDTAYGVMSWWDYGHFIEAIGHRMPNANPFQAGIGGRRGSINETNQPGAASFLLAQSEKEGNALLKGIDPRPGKVGARYIITTKWMAVDIFGAMTQWTLEGEAPYYQPVWIGDGYRSLPTMRYYDSMLVRLQLFDGNGLKQYRMVHETLKPQDSYNSQGELIQKYVYNYLYEGNISLVNTGYLKIFEYVKGANITGTASANEPVTISNTIKTGQNRTFEYSQSTTADSQGKYKFTVPYSTEGPIPGETQFDTAPTGPYKVSYGDKTKEVKVSENAVLKGEEITV